MESNLVWVGIDVGRYFHAWCALDGAGQVIWRRNRVANTTKAMAQALGQLRKALPGAALRFAAEEAGGNAAALARLLAAEGEEAFLAQPLRVHRFHLALGAPHKSDPYDAQVIAEFARQYAHRLPRIRPGTPELRALRVLSRRLESVNRDLRRSLNRLRSTLAEYAPEWLVCGVFSDWSTQAALGTLERFGRVSKLRRTPLGRLALALSGWTRGRFKEDHAQRLLEAFDEVGLPPLLEAAYFQAIRSQASQIRHLLAVREELQALLAQSQVPAFRALQAEFGYGLETAAVIVSEVGEIDDFEREARFAAYCGVTPVTRASGCSAGSSRLGRFTNKRLLRAIFQATVATVRRDPRSQAFYQAKLNGRADPRSRTTALLALSRHRVRRLYKLLKAATPSPLEAAA